MLNCINKVYAMKITLLFPVLLIFSLFSCSRSQATSQLLDIESYIMERPGSALAVLEAMDRNLLVSQEDCAHHALLHAMSLDKNFIDVADDSLARVAVNYYSEHGPDKYHARSLYYLGLAYFYQNDYKKAIVEFTKAEELARYSDSLYLAMTKIAQADTYAKTYNLIEGEKCLRDACYISAKNGDLYNLQVAKLRLAQSLFNSNNDDEAHRILDELIYDEATDVKVKYVASVTKVFVLVSHQDACTEALDIYDVMTENEEIFDYMSFKDYWAWAYALNAVGRKEEAQGLLEQLVLEESGTSSYWQYMIAKSDGSMQLALKHLEDYIKYNDVEVSDALRQSLALSQRDYYESQSELSKSQARSSRLWMLVILLSCALGLVFIVISVLWYVKKQNHIKEQYILYINEIRRQLGESKREDYPALKKKYMSLYKSKFELIGELCEQYIYSQGLVNAEKSIYKKVVSLVDDFTSDYTNKEKFEAMLNEDLDNIMSNLRAEMPSLKEKDYMIFSFLVIGFDVTTISILLNITPNTIYIRKSRIKHQIMEQGPIHKEQFIEAMC